MKVSLYVKLVIKYGPFTFPYLDTFIATLSRTHEFEFDFQMDGKWEKTWALWKSRPLKYNFLIGPVPIDISITGAVTLGARAILGSGKTLRMGFEYYKTSSAGIKWDLKSKRMVPVTDSATRLTKREFACSARVTASLRLCSALTPRAHASPLQISRILTEIPGTCAARKFFWKRGSSCRRTWTSPSSR